MRRAKRPKAVWVAVPRKQPDRLDAGYWLASTRGELERVVLWESALPEDWVPRRVIITPAPTKPRRARKEARDAD